MENSVRLDKLPAGLNFPAELKDRIMYDGTRRRLIFRGFMCKADYDGLARLSDCVKYHRAIDGLFVSTSDQPPWAPRWAVVIGVIAIGILAAALACWWWMKH